MRCRRPIWENFSHFLTFSHLFPHFWKFFAKIEIRSPSSAAARTLWRDKPRPSGFPSPPQVGCPTIDVRSAQRGPPGEGEARFSHGRCSRLSSGFAVPRRVASDNVGRWDIENCSASPLSSPPGEDGPWFSHGRCSRLSSGVCGCCAGSRRIMSEGGTLRNCSAPPLSSPPGEDGTWFSDGRCSRGSHGGAAGSSVTKAFLFATARLSSHSGGDA